MEKMKIKERVNWPVTILLLLGLITVAFPLYMTIVIALKKPSEMTNSISGILSLPSHLSLDNFAEAMRVTDFWHSLGNSLLITLVTIVLAILIHSIAGYVIGRGMRKIKGFKFIYFYIVSGMFVPFSILMMPLVKQTAQMGIGNRFGVIVLYLVLYANECAFIQWISEKHPGGNGRSGKYRWSQYMDNILAGYFPDDETNACHSCNSDSSRYLE